MFSSDVLQVLQISIGEHRKAWDSLKRCRHLVMAHAWIRGAGENGIGAAKAIALLESSPVANTYGPTTLISISMNIQVAPRIQQFTSGLVYGTSQQYSL
eukprot:g34514.t1